MAIVSKDIGSIVVAAGTLKVSVYYDNAIISDSSQIPNASETFVSMDDFVERIEKKSGLFEIANVNVELKDYYANHVAGVWYKLLNNGSEVQFRFYLDEGVGDTFLFWGMLQKDGVVNFKEKYISNPGSTGRYIRTAKITLISLLYKLKTTSVSDVITQIAANDANDSLAGTSITFQKLIGCIAVAAFGGTDASITNSGSFATGNAEVQFQTTAGVWENIQNLYIRVQLTNSPITVSPYFDSLDGTGRYWPGRFTNALELLSFLAKSYGYLIRYSFGQADGTIAGSADYHRLHFVQRGKIGNLITKTDLKSSEIAFDNSLTPTSIYFSRFDDSNPYGSVGGDIELRIDFLYQSAALNDYEKLYYYNGTSHVYVTSVRFYNYSTGAYASSGYTTEALYYYHLYKITKDTQKYRREYKGIKGTYSGTDSHRHLITACRIAIHDGVASKDFYANEVRKNVYKNRSIVEWVEE